MNGHFPKASGIRAQNDSSSSGCGDDKDRRRLKQAAARLRYALDRTVTEFDNGEIAKARNELRTVAAELRDAGYWAEDKAELRSIVALLWEADRYVGTHELRKAAGCSAEGGES